MIWTCCGFYVDMFWLSYCEEWSFLIIVQHISFLLLLQLDCCWLQVVIVLSPFLLKEIFSIVKGETSPLTQGLWNRKRISHHFYVTLTIYIYVCLDRISWVISMGCAGLARFYGISTIVCYLMPNTFNTYTSYIYL